MKLVMAIVQAKDADVVVANLAERGHRVTQINSAGGFLRESNVTLMVGVEASQVAEVYRVIGQTCTTRTQYVNPLLPIMEPGEFSMPDPVEVQVGGAAIFVLDVARLVRV